MKKRLLTIAVVLLVLVVAAAAGLWWMAHTAQNQLTAENLVRILESQCNLRAHVGKSTPELFRSPARIFLEDVRIVPRDGEADAAVPLAARTTIVRKGTYIYFTSASLDVDLWGLLFRRKINIRELVVERADIKGTIMPHGDNTLRQLFGPPAVVGGKPNAALMAVAAPAAAVIAATPAPNTPSAPPEPAPPAEPKPRKKKGEATEPPPDASAPDAERPPARVFSAKDLPFAIDIRRIAFNDARLRLRNKKTKSQFELGDLSLAITNVAVDPANLGRENRATVRISTKLSIDSQKNQSLRYCELLLAAEGGIMPFDPVTSAFNPDTGFKTVLQKGSFIQGLPAMQKLQKNLDMAQQAGLALKDLSAKATLQRDASLMLHLRNNRLDLNNDETLLFEDYELRMAMGGFIDVSDDTHRFDARLVASEALSRQALDGADQFLKKLPGNTGAELKQLFIDPLTKDGRVAVGFATAGELDEPKVKMDNPLKDSKQLLKEKGLDLLNGLLNKDKPATPEQPPAPTPAPVNPPASPASPAPEPAPAPPVAAPVPTPATPAPDAPK